MAEHHGRKIANLILYTAKKQILLQDRKTCSKRGEEWGFFGGGIEKGETSEKAMLRELKEETGITPNKHKFIGEIENILSDGYLIHRFVFIAPFEAQDKIKKVNEGAGMKLFDIKEARKLKLVPGDEKVLDLIEKNIYS